MGAIYGIFGGDRMKLILPLSVTLPRKTTENKVWHLGLNQYRNTHHFTLNAAKIAYSENIRRALYEGDRRARGMNLDTLTAPYRFVYTIFAASGRRFDLSNILSIVDKFTCDPLVDYGILPDDSWKVIPAIDYRFGGIDKDRPRVELQIQSFDGEAERMAETCRIADEVL